MWAGEEAYHQITIELHSISTENALLYFSQVPFITMLVLEIYAILEGKSWLLFDCRIIFITNLIIVFIVVNKLYCKESGKGANWYQYPYQKECTVKRIDSFSSESCFEKVGYVKHQIDSKNDHASELNEPRDGLRCFSLEYWAVHFLFFC